MTIATEIVVGQSSNRTDLWYWRLVEVNEHGMEQNVDSGDELTPARAYFKAAGRLLQLQRERYFHETRTN